MRKFVIGFTLGVAAASTASALALSAGQSLTLKPGDTASISDVARFGQPTCQAVVKRGVPTLSCFVDSAGGELRKRFGVTISNTEVTVNRYYGPASARPYKVIFRRDEKAGFVAH